MKKVLKYIALSLGGMLVILSIHFFTIRYLDQKINKDTVVVPSSDIEYSKHFLPTSFIDGERFYFKVAIGQKDTIMAFGDTGGGISMLIPHDKNYRIFDSRLKTGIVKGLMPMDYVLFNEVVKDPKFPIPQTLDKFIIRTPFFRVKEPYLLIPPLENEVKLMMEVQPETDAFFGQTFFMDHSWTIDYLNEKIWVNTPLNKSEKNHLNVQKLGFKKNANGAKINGHPSMVIEVDGDSIDVLFDTGASLVLSDTGREQFHTDKKTMGGSFIAASLFDKWRKNHPEWNYYPNSDLLGDVIEVPSIKIGEHEVGPALFARRRDEVWSEGMISSMDKVVKGAVGGSVLKYFKVTVDYNSDLIRLER